MPSLAVVQSLVAQYAPVVKLNPRYLPSGVEFYLDNVEYVRSDGPILQPPLQQQSLRPGTSGDNDYLRIPGQQGQPAYDKITAGDLASAKAYVHVLGLTPNSVASWLDIEYWFFYPYNGPGSARLQLSTPVADATINVDFQIFGEHEGDWEHITVRLMYITRDLYIPVGVYFAQHDGGEWVMVHNVERTADGRFVVYSSRDGHASFPSPGIFPTTKAKFDFSYRSVGVSGFLANDCTRNTTELDTRPAHTILAIDNVVDEFYQPVTVVEPVWLQFLGRWGRVWTDAERQERAQLAIYKMTGEIADALPGFAKIFADAISERVVEVIKKFVDLDEIVPEGPKGLKDKQAWTAEEGEAPTPGWNSFIAAPNTDVFSVLNEMSAFIATYDAAPGVVCTAKMAACNQRSGNARGVVFYYLGGLPLEPLTGTGWSAQVFRTKIHYDDELYAPALRFLRGDDGGLTLEQSVTAQVTMSNYEHGTATLAVWWPKQAEPQS